MTPQQRRDIENRRILDLMAAIETKTELCFHEATDSELELRCIEALDGKRDRIRVINELCKIIDEMNERTEA